MSTPIETTQRINLEILQTATFLTQDKFNQALPVVAGQLDPEALLGFIQEFYPSPEEIIAIAEKYKTFINT
jgi:hypothetical protein